MRMRIFHKISGPSSELQDGVPLLEPFVAGRNRRDPVAQPEIGCEIAHALDEARRIAANIATLPQLVQKR